MNEPIESRLLRALGRVVAGTVLGLALLWFLLVPRFPSGCRLNANESAAIATLKNIHSAQSQFRAAAWIDRDRDGLGEFGWFRELAAAAPLRGTGSPLAAPLLSRTFGQLTDGRVMRSGYCFQLWLPAHRGGWLAEGGSGAIDADAAEENFHCGAWPLSEASARRAFFTDATGTVWACSNRDRRYCGTGRPLPGRALVPPGAALANMEMLGAGDWCAVE